MKNNNIILPPGKIKGLKQLPDSSWEIKFEPMDEGEYLECIFDDNPKVNKKNAVLIDIRKISLENELFKWNTTTHTEEAAKNLMMKAIRADVQPFFCSRCAPGTPDIFDRIKLYPIKEDYIQPGERICIKPGKRVARAKSCEEWVEVVESYMPSYSRIGTELEYGAFLLILMSNLLESGMNLAEVWNAVCNDSKGLGVYCDSENTSVDFGATGSKYVGGFYDLGNNFKLLVDSQRKGEFYLAAGCRFSKGTEDPISKVIPFNETEQDKWEYIVPWIVFSNKFGNA